MWSRKHETWKRYHQDVLAMDHEDAFFLSAYIRYANLHRIDAHITEVIDLQRYKLVRKPGLVRSAMREKKHDPFIFFFALN